MSCVETYDKVFCFRLLSHARDVIIHTLIQFAIICKTLPQRVLATLQMMRVVDKYTIISPQAALF